MLKSFLSLNKSKVCKFPNKGRYIVLAIISFVCVSLAPARVNAQDNQDFVNIVNGDLSKMLPPLNVLIDSAITHDPSIRSRDLQVIVNECNIKTQKTQWGRNIGFQTDVRYGTFTNLSSNIAEGQGADILSSKSHQTNYAVGAYIKFPIQDIINRKNLIELAKAELNQSYSMAEAQRNELRQMVIKQYNELLLKHKLFKIRVKYFETSRINIHMAEESFLNGSIDVTEYSRISEIAARAESDYETARTDFITSYMILEEIVKMRFNLISVR